MYLKKCQRHVNPKFFLCHLPARANSKNKTEDLVYCRLILLFGIAIIRIIIVNKGIAIYIIKHSSNVSLIRCKYRNPVTFQTRCLATDDIGFLQLTGSCFKFNVIAIQYTYQTFLLPRKWTIFSLVRNWYAEKYLHLKARSFRKSNLSWHQQKSMGVTSLKALNKFVVLLSFTAMQLKKNTTIWKIRAFSHYT